MFTTSLTATVVAGLFASGTLSGPPEWTTNYSVAFAQAGEKHKPMAVFISPGDPTNVIGGKGFNPDALKVLKSDYIAVQIDPTTADGLINARAFGMTQGLVLTDHTGKSLALKHEGPVSPEELSKYLVKYAEPMTIRTTETHVVPVSVSVATTPTYTPSGVYQSPQQPPQYFQPQYQPQQYQQAQYQQPQYQPQQYAQPVQYQQPRPVLNALQNFGGAVQNFGGNVIAPLSGGS